MVDFRKLISFGKSSYVISLPKSWIDKNKMKKGSLIAVREDSETLILSPKLEEEKEEPKSIKINVDGKGYKRLKREIISAYINNNHSIILVGAELKTKAGDLRDILHNIMALEIMEQTSDTVIARDFLNMTKLDFEGIIRKMDVTFRSMISDAKDSFDMNHYEHIRQREEDVDRLAFLIYRMVKHALNKPSQAKKLGVNSVDLLNFWWLAQNLEKATDKVKHLAKLTAQMKVTPKLKTQISAFLKQLETNFTTTMKAYYSKNIELAFKVADEKEPLVNECIELQSKTWKIKHMPEILEYVKEAAVSIHNIGRIIYS